MFGIYRTINSIFEKPLERCGYKYKEKIKSNIYPSIVYSNGILELQIGYNYETSLPFAHLYGRMRVCPPLYQKAIEKCLKETN